MIAQLLGGALAGILAVALYHYFTRIDADRAPLLKYLGPKAPKRVPMPRGFEKSDDSEPRKRCGFASA